MPRHHTYGALWLSFILVGFSGFLCFLKYQGVGYFPNHSWWFLTAPLWALLVIWSVWTAAFVRYRNLPY